MILKRKEKDGKIKVMYDSSTILASTFDKLNNDLIVIFKNGGQYKYPNVKSTDYLSFETAESQGKVFSAKIKPYLFEKLDNISPDVIINEIATLKISERKSRLNAKQGVVIRMMETLIKLSTIDQETFLYTKSQLTPLTDAINSYITEIDK